MRPPSNSVVCIVGYYSSSQHLNEELWDYDLAGVKTAMSASTSLQSLFFLGSLLVNFFIILRIIRKKLLNQPTYILIFNLAIIDLLLTITFLFFNIITGFSSHYSFGDTDFARCQICRVFSVSIILYFVSSAVLVLISLDRLAYFKIPLRYSSMVTCRRTVYALIVAWGIGVVMILPPLFGYGDALFSLLCGYVFLSTKHTEHSTAYLMMVVIIKILFVTVSFVTNMWVVCIAIRQHRASNIDIGQVEFPSPDIQVEEEEKEQTNNRKLGKYCRLCQVVCGNLVIHLITLLPQAVLFILLISKDWISVFLFHFSLVCFASQVLLHPITISFFAPEILVLVSPSCIHSELDPHHPTYYHSAIRRALGAMGVALSSVGVSIATKKRSSKFLNLKAYKARLFSLRRRASTVPPEEEVPQEQDDCMNQENWHQQEGEREVASPPSEPRVLEVVVDIEPVSPSRPTSPPTTTSEVNEGNIAAASNTLSSSKLPDLVIITPCATNPLTDSPMPSPCEVKAVSQVLPDEGMMPSDGLVLENTGVVDEPSATTASIGPPSSTSSDVVLENKGFLECSKNVPKTQLSVMNPITEGLKSPTVRKAPLSEGGESLVPNISGIVVVVTDEDTNTSVPLLVSDTPSQPIAAAEQYHFVGGDQPCCKSQDQLKCENTPNSTDGVDQGSSSDLDDVDQVSEASQGTKPDQPNLASGFNAAVQADLASNCDGKDCSTSSSPRRVEAASASGARGEREVVNQAYEGAAYEGAASFRRPSREESINRLRALQLGLDEF